MTVQTEFDANGNPDIIIRSSSDGGRLPDQEFLVHRALLSVVSSVLQQTIDSQVDQKLDSQSFTSENSLPVVLLPESTTTINRLLHFIYPTTYDPSVTSFDDIVALLEAAFKYKLKIVLHSLSKILESPDFMQKDAVRVFAIAFRFALDRVALQASRHTLDMDRIIDLPLMEECESIPSEALFALIELRWKRIDGIDNILRNHTNHWCSECNSMMEFSKEYRGYSTELSDIRSQSQDVEKIPSNPFPEIPSLLPCDQNSMLFTRLIKCEKCTKTFKNIMLQNKSLIDKLPAALEQDRMELIIEQTAKSWSLNCEQQSAGIAGDDNQSESKNHAQEVEEIRYGIEPADIILQASHDVKIESAQVKCFVHKTILSSVSSVFKAMLETASEDPSQNGNECNSLPVVEMKEQAEALKTLLRCIYPISGFSSLLPASCPDKLFTVYLLAHKYDIPSLMKSLEEDVLSPSFLSSKPLRIYAIACQLQLQTVERAVLPYTFSHNLQGALLPKDLEGISAYDYHALLRVHLQRSKLIGELLRQNPPIGSSTSTISLSTCSNCQNRYSSTPKWWTTYQKYALNAAKGGVSVDGLMDMKFIVKVVSSIAHECSICPLSVLKSHDFLKNLQKRLEDIPVPDSDNSIR